MGAVVYDVIGIKVKIVYVKIGNPAFCLFSYLTGVPFRGELQNVDYFSEQKIKC